MRKMSVPRYCDDCLREKNCFVKVGLEGLKIMDCTNKISDAPQNIAEAGDTAHNNRMPKCCDGGLLNVSGSTSAYGSCMQFRS